MRKLIGHLTLNIHKLSWYVNRLNVIFILLGFLYGFDILMRREEPLSHIISLLVLVAGCIAFNEFVILTPSTRLDLINKGIDKID